MQVEELKARAQLEIATEKEAFVTKRLKEMLKDLDRVGKDLDRLRSDCDKILAMTVDEAVDFLRWRD